VAVKRVPVALDVATLRELAREAMLAYEKARMLFEKYDNHEDMEAMDRWEATLTWLENKLLYVRKKESTQRKKEQY